MSFKEFLNEISYSKKELEAIENEFSGDWDLDLKSAKKGVIKLGDSSVDGVITKVKKGNKIAYQAKIDGLGIKSKSNSKPTNDDDIESLFDVIRDIMYP